MTDAEARAEIDAHRQAAATLAAKYHELRAAVSRLMFGSDTCDHGNLPWLLRRSASFCSSSKYPDQAMEQAVAVRLAADMAEDFIKAFFPEQCR